VVGRSIESIPWSRTLPVCVSLPPIDRNAGRNSRTVHPTIMDLSYRYLLVDRFREGKKCRLSNSSHPDKASHPWFESSIFRWCRPIGIPAVKPLCSFLTLLPIKSILRCPEAGERKEGLIDQLEQIHNLLPSVLNEGIKAGIVELNCLILRWVISSCIRIKPTISSHERLSIPSLKVLQYKWPCFKAPENPPYSLSIKKRPFPFPYSQVAQGPPFFNNIR